MKGAYLLLSYSYKPVPNGPNKGKMQAHEQCMFSDRIKDRELQTASIIMDVRERKFVKNSLRENGLTYEDAENHVLKSYKEKYEQFLKIAEAPLPTQLQEIEKENKEIEANEETESEDAGTDESE